MAQTKISLERKSNLQINTQKYFEIFLYVTHLITLALSAKVVSINVSDNWFNDFSEALTKV